MTNTINNKIYIGSSVNAKCRIRNHRCDLRKNRHSNAHLQASANKYGADNFKFEIIEECNVENLVEREQFYIDTLKPEYNILEKAYSPVGYKHTEEFKRKASIRMKNSIVSGKIDVQLSAAKIDESTVINIVNDIKSLTTVKSILKKYNVSRSLFNAIIQRRSWKQITSKLTDEDLYRHKEFQNKKSHKSSGRRKTTPEQCKEIREMFKSGISAINIAKKFSLHRDGVYYILNERKTD